MTQSAGLLFWLSVICFGMISCSSSDEKRFVSKETRGQIFFQNDVYRVELFGLDSHTPPEPAMTEPYPQLRVFYLDEMIAEFEYLSGIIQRLPIIYDRENRSLFIQLVSGEATESKTGQGYTIQNELVVYRFSNKQYREVFRKKYPLSHGREENRFVSSYVLNLSPIANCVQIVGLDLKFAPTEDIAFPEAKVNALYEWREKQLDFIKVK